MLSLQIETDTRRTTSSLRVCPGLCVVLFQERDTRRAHSLLRQESLTLPLLCCATINRLFFSTKGKTETKFTYGQSYSCFFTHSSRSRKDFFNLLLLPGDGCVLCWTREREKENMSPARLTLNSRKKEFWVFSSVVWVEQCNLIFLSWRSFGWTEGTMRYRTNLFHFLLVFTTILVVGDEPQLRARDFLIRLTYRVFFCAKYAHENFNVCYWNEVKPTASGSYETRKDNDNYRRGLALGCVKRRERVKPLQDHIHSSNAETLRISVVASHCDCCVLQDLR